MAGLPGGSKEPFFVEEMDLLMHEVKALEQTIYGSWRIPPKLPEVKQVWEEVALNISSSSSIASMAVQYLKCFNFIHHYYD